MNKINIFLSNKINIFLSIKINIFLSIKDIYVFTVKPVLRGHLWDKEKDEMFNDLTRKKGIF